ncbi:MAG: hypothetical protein ACXVFV_08505 [Mycobacteriales bacterium]
MPRPSTRLAAGTLVLALPLAAAAGCGVEKRQSVKAELTAAEHHLGASRSASFTLRVDDSKGSLAALATKDGSTPKALAQDLLRTSITYTVDAAGNATLAGLSGRATGSLAEQLKKVDASVLVRDGSAELGELRLVAGVLYARVDLTEIGRLAEEGGVEDFDRKLDDAVASADPRLATGLKDVRAGKWVRLPLASYLDKFQELAKGFTGITPEATTPGKADYDGLGKRLFAAVKPYVKVTDANDSSSDRVLDVDVKARPAVKAALAVLQAEKGLPFAGLLRGTTPADVDSKLADGTAHGTITLASGHLKQVTVDMESIRSLDPKPGKDRLTGSSVVLDVDDSAGRVSAPTDLSSFDLGALIDSFLSQAQGADQQG